MRGEIAKRWQAADAEGKLALMARAREADCPLDTELLGASTAEMDQFAREAGLVPVFVATVDGCGLSCPAPGVVSPALAGQYRARRWRHD